MVRATVCSRSERMRGQSIKAIHLPDPGQLVHVRSRRFVVLQSAEAQAPASGPTGWTQPPPHLVTLSSVDDDGIGEKIDVIWEIEPGAMTIERNALPEPTGFDAPERFAAFLNAVRWGAVSATDTRSLQAPFRSGIEIEDYQLDPVVRALKMPRVNLLIADDVGLGKTIESGLVIQELLVRHRARTVLIICPSSL